MIDHIDEKILAELRRNAKQTTGSIARRINVPTTTVHNRIKRMEHKSIIIRYEPVLSYEKLGKGIGALIFVVAERVDQENLAKKLKTLPGVEHVRIITGGYDLMFEVRVGSMDELNTLIVKELRKIPGVEKTQTMMLLKEF